MFIAYVETVDMSTTDSTINVGNVITHDVKDGIGGNCFTAPYPANVATAHCKLKKRHARFVADSDALRYERCIRDELLRPVPEALHMLLYNFEASVL